jgi:hypothetical protein
VAWRNRIRAGRSPLGRRGSHGTPRTSRSS